MRVSSTLRTVMIAFSVAAVVYAYRTGQPAGRFLKVPYDFRFPTIQRFRDRLWNPDDPRMFTPHPFGVGWTLNLYRIRERLRGALLARASDEER